MLSGEVGWADGYGDTTTLPFYKNFYAGGVNTVRGYKAGSLGPQTVDVNGNISSLGGTKRFVGNAELLWGVSGMEKTLRFSLFFDAGQVFGPGVPGFPTPGEDFDFAKLRYSTGLAAAWISPMGPLKFSYGYPLNSESGDKIERFQFQLGTTF
jgi:outer membrane protein insertion porin family